MSKIIIKNGHLLDPLNQIDEVCDLRIEEGVIAEIAPSLTIPKSAEVLDVKGAYVAPGFVDLHVHFREPGQEYKETIATGSRAAAAGGFTSVCCMANTSPVNDHGAITEFILKKAKEEACVHVFPIGSVTKNLEGKELSEIGELKSAGCVALSDDGKTIENNALLRHAMEYAKGFELPLISHALCHDLMGKGVMNEGPVATELGLKGIPHEAEEIIIARDIALSALTDHPIHIAHVSTARGVELVREAKKRRLKVSCEVCPHHFTLTDEACRSYDPNTKMAPPLRTQKDIEAIRKGLADGTIDAIATDHAPHSLSDKEVGFEEAPFGIIGLETAFPLSMKLVQEKVISLKRLVELLSLNPSKILGLNKGHLSLGSLADLAIFSTEAPTIYDVNQSASKSRNSPFHQWRMAGKVLYTIVSGQVVFRHS